MKKPGLSVVIPGLGRRKILTLLSDYTGTLSVDGKLTAGARQSLLELSKKVDVHILTADTFGTAQAQLKGIPLRRHRLKGPGGDHDVQKRQFLGRFDARAVAAFGNGNNDRLLLRAVKESGGLAIAVDNGEGCAVDSIQSANVFIFGASNALGVLLKKRSLESDSSVLKGILFAHCDPIIAPLTSPTPGNYDAGHWIGLLP